MKPLIPTVSVMLCAYNAEKYIHETIESVLNQTYTNFEFIIIDDGSTDNTVDTIKRYRDKRIRIFRGRHNYIHSLNLGMRNCRGEYIARIDADDRMKPERLEKQIQIMKDHPDIAACFSWAEKFGASDGIHGFNVKGKVKNSYFWLLTGNFLTHPTVMLRKSFMKEHHLYYKNYPYAEDYKLWTDIARIGDNIYVIPEPLTEYRISTTQVSYIHNEEQKNTRLIIEQEVLEELLHRIEHPQKQALIRLYNQMLRLNEGELVEGKEVIVLLYKLLHRTNLFN